MRRFLTTLALSLLLVVSSPFAASGDEESSSAPATLKASVYVSNLDLIPVSCAPEQSARIFLNLPKDVAWVLNQWMPHDLALNMVQPESPLSGTALHLNRLLTGSHDTDGLNESVEHLAQAGLSGFFVPRLLVFPDLLLPHLQDQRCTNPLILLAYARRLTRDGLSQAAMQEVDSCTKLPAETRNLVKAQLLVDHGEARSAKKLLKARTQPSSPSCISTIHRPQSYLGEGYSAFELRLAIELALRKNDPNEARKSIEELSRWFNRDPDTFALYVDLCIRLGDPRLNTELLEKLKRDPRLNVLRWILLDRVATLKPGPTALALLKNSHEDLLTEEGGMAHAFRLALASGETAAARAFRNKIANPPEDLDQRLNYQEGKTSDFRAKELSPLLGDTILKAAESRLGAGTILLDEKLHITVSQDKRKTLKYRWVFGRSHGSEGDDSPTVRVTTDPGRESLHPSEVSVRCGPRSGTLSAEEDFEDLAEEDLRIFYNLREHRFRFPPLSPGCVASLEVTVQELEALPFDGYFGREVPLDRGWPTRRFELRYSLPQGIKLHHKVLSPMHGGDAPDFAAEPTSNDRGGMDYSYILHDLKSRNTALMLPGGSDLHATLLVSTFPNAGALASWYQRWGLGQAQILPNETLVEIFGESLSGTPREKLEKAYHFVSKEIRYVGLEFGVHSYQPYPVKTVLKRRFGDCKDKARLMRDLLHNVGIKSHLVLVRPRNYGRLPKDTERLPLPLDSFFHASLAVEEPGKPGYLFVDPTSHDRSLETAPALVQDSTALLLKPGFPRMIRLPVATASENADQTRILVGRDRMFIEADLSGILATPARRSEDLEKAVRAWLDGAFDGGLIAQSKLTIETREVQEHLVLKILVQFPEGQSPQVIRPIQLLNATCSQLPEAELGYRGDLLAARMRSLELTLDSGGSFPSARTSQGGMLQYTVPSAMKLHFSVEEEAMQARFEVGSGPQNDLGVPPTYLNDLHAICTSLIDLRTLTLRPRWTP